MILVDTSVWVDHLQRGNAQLAEQLGKGQVLAHPFVLGELALGSIQQRTKVLDAMQNLPMAAVANSDELLTFIGAHALHGMGIGYVDAHLLASSRLSPAARLWTLDKCLQAAAQHMRLATFQPAQP